MFGHGGLWLVVGRVCGYLEFVVTGSVATIVFVVTRFCGLWLLGSVVSWSLWLPGLWLLFFVVASFCG